MHIGFALAAIGAMLPAAASAQEPESARITGGPAIAGAAIEGATLTATATWSGFPAPTVSWEWLRCVHNENACRAIDGAADPQYLVTSADVGSVLRARLTVTNESGTDSERSEPTATVTVAPPPPPPPPIPNTPPAPTPTPNTPPAPTPTTTPDATAPPTPAADATAPPAPTPVPEPAVAPRLLDPFPVVRIRGRLTPAGARLSLFTVRAARGARIVVRCRGASCPVRRFTRRAARTRVRPLERNLRAGTRLLVTVTRPGFVGKWTRIVIRRGAVPSRRDRCLYPGAGAPVRCPAA